MLLLDVNVCVHAIHPETSTEARQVREWLIEAINGEERIGVSELVLSSMIRIATNVAIFDQPSTPHQAVEFSDLLLAAPAVVNIRPGRRHWRLFTTLVDEQRLRHNQVPDAYFAAMAMENGATFVTRDRGFRRYPALRVLDPLA